jgi:hypothetical protein
MLRDDKGGEVEKIVVQFRKRDKKLVLNKTNAETIARMLGDDTDDWIGKEIQLYPAQVNFAGQMVPAVRVYEDAPAAAEGEDEIPF